VVDCSVHRLATERNSALDRRQLAATFSRDSRDSSRRLAHCGQHSDRRQGHDGEVEPYRQGSCLRPRQRKKYGRRSTTGQLSIDFLLFSHASAVCQARSDKRSPAKSRLPLLQTTVRLTKSHASCGNQTLLSPSARLPGGTTTAMTMLEFVRSRVAIWLHRPLQLQANDCSAAQENCTVTVVLA
jgi:hypothetical protein